jgi:primosomal replication protein N
MSKSKKRKGSFPWQRGHNGLNSVNMSGCVTTEPRLHHTPDGPLCTFGVCDDRTARESKFEIEAAVYGGRAVEMKERARPGVRVAITGMLCSESVPFAGVEVLDYRLAVSYMDLGESLQGESQERAGINHFAMSGALTRAPEVVGLPGRDSCVFWMCDGDSEASSGVRLPVHIAPGKVSELFDHVVVGDRLVVGGFLVSQRQRVSGVWVSEYRLIAQRVDGGFLVDRGD